MPVNDKALSEREAVHNASLRRIRAANRDLAERIKPDEVSIVYDTDDDTFLATFGSPVEAVSESMGNEVFFRLELSTDKIVGLEILNLTANMSEDAQLRGLVIGLLRSTHPSKLTIFPPPKSGGNGFVDYVSRELAGMDA